MLASLKVETFSPRYQDTPNCNALHERETSDEMIRTLPYFSSLSLFFLRQINRFLPARRQIGASGLSMIERLSFLPPLLTYYEVEATK